MTAPRLHARRATLDDLPALQALWHAAQLPVAPLEARLTEFQVVEYAGQFAGALGLEFSGQHVRLYAEDYPDFAHADAARELFWERLVTLAANHGAFRVWTQETSPFWTHWGFHPAHGEVLGQLPADWRALPGDWLTLELKNAEIINAVVEKELLPHQAEEKSQTARLTARARKIKWLITVVGFVAGAIGISIALWRMFHPLHPRP